MLFVVVAAGLVVASVLTDSLPLAIAGLVVALVALGLMVWPVLMARRAAAVAAEEREEAATVEPPPTGEPAESAEPQEAAEPQESAEPPEAAEPDVRAPAVVEEPAPVAEEPAAGPVPAAAEPAEEPVAAVSTVLVVPGRHRYHQAGCSMLDGREPETLDLDEAREEGFTPCSRCAGDRVSAPGS
jgi:outer membrane biosynthesis protein TonB